MHTGPEMFVSNIAGDESRTRVALIFMKERRGEEKEGKKSNVLPSELFQLILKEGKFFRYLHVNIVCVMIRDFYHVVKEKRVQQLKTLSKRPFRPDSEYEINTACISHIMITYLLVSKRFMAIRRS